IRFHGVRGIHVHSFVGGIIHLYDAVLDRHGYGNPARMDRQHFLVSAKQLHRLEIGLEFEFCSRIEAERAAECRSEAFLGLRHHIYGEYCRMCAGLPFPLLRLVGTAGAPVGGVPVALAPFWSSSGSASLMRTVPDTPGPSTPRVPKVVNPMTWPAPLNRCPPEFPGLMLISDMMVCGSTLLTMPVVMILSRLSGLPMVNTRSPSWTGVLPAPARYSGAGEALGRAAMLTDSNATSF